MRPCLACGALTNGSRCPAHRLPDRRPSRQARGYGPAHEQARALLALLLPAPCGYCAKTIFPNERWHAAHVVDGDPSAGYIVAHPVCNERNKKR